MHAKLENISSSPVPILEATKDSLHSGTSNHCSNHAHQSYIICSGTIHKYVCDNISAIDTIKHNILKVIPLARTQGGFEGVRENPPFCNLKLISSLKIKY